MKKGMDEKNIADVLSKKLTIEIKVMNYERKSAVNHYETVG